MKTGTSQVKNRLDWRQTTSEEQEQQNDDGVTDTTGSARVDGEDECESRCGGEEMKIQAAELVKACITILR